MIYIKAVIATEWLPARGFRQDPSCEKAVASSFPTPLEGPKPSRRQHDIERHVGRLEFPRRCITGHVQRRGLQGTQLQTGRLVHQSRRRVAARFGDIGTVARASQIVPIALTREAAVEGETG